MDRDVAQLRKALTLSDMFDGSTPAVQREREIVRRRF